MKIGTPIGYYQRENGPNGLNDKIPYYAERENIRLKGGSYKTRANQVLIKHGNDVVWINTKVWCLTKA